MTRLRRGGGAAGVDSGGAARSWNRRKAEPRVWRPRGTEPRRWGRGFSRDMRLSWVLTVLSICLSALATAAGAEGKRKLQIGVKKRVDHCPIKSRKGDVLHMHYTGKLEDGTEFDSSLPQNQPFVFSLGTGQVIKGWDQGLLGMCEGEKRKLVIPSELGYGERGAPPKIPGGATLVFEVELLKIERRSEL
uniref:peptidylprolyl isomerase n=1 Tax=Equus caballus TaxID=9796 RepID=A0A9L0RI29_HORSE